MSKPAPGGGSLALRLALIYAITALGVVVVVGGGIYLTTARYLTSSARDSLADLAGFYAAYTAATATDPARLAALAPQIATFSTEQGGHDVRIFGQGGTLLAASRDLGPLPSHAALAALGGRRPTLFVAASDDRPGRMYAARPVAAPGGELLAVVEVSRDQGEVEGLLATARLVLAGASVMALVASLAAGLLLVRQVARPVREVEAATRAIAAGEFDRRLAATRNDEIGRLAQSVNQMAADLARLEAARRDFIARISHDLRTPLTAIKGLAINMQDVAPDEMVPSLAMVDEQVDRLIRLVDDLLTLSRLQRGEMRLRQQVVDLGAVARAVLVLALPQSERRAVSLEIKLDRAAQPVRGDGDRLQQVAINLIDNALRVTQPGGHVHVAVEARDGETALVVTDEGPGLTEEEAARAFEPYVRGPGGGAGLGLAIAREIVAAHRGRIWLRPRAEGGAEAGFALPALPEGPAVRREKGLKPTLLSVLVLLLLATGCTEPPTTPSPARVDEGDLVIPGVPGEGGYPTLADFWEGRAEFVVEVRDTGLPRGESDTVVMGNGELWSYLHASDRSAGIVDRCGDPVEFPGCTVLYKSTDGGLTFSPPDPPTCLFECATCPCQADVDHVVQQQYPRVHYDGQALYLVYEYLGRVMLRRSADGLTWSAPQRVDETGIWKQWLRSCPFEERIGRHPYVRYDYECLAGGPPGIWVEDDVAYVFLAVGQNPGGMGCYFGPAWAGADKYRPCYYNPLFSGAAEYGPLDVSGPAANPYFDFRTISSAEVVKIDDRYYMLYEGIRGPEPGEAGDSQFGLGLARSVGDRIDGLWETYPGNPILLDLPGNIGLGHADLVVIEGRTILYTALERHVRSRLALVWKR